MRDIVNKFPKVKDYENKQKIKRKDEREKIKLNIDIKSCETNRE